MDRPVVNINIKIELCKNFYNEYRLPKRNENNINKNVKFNKIIDETEKLELCKEFYTKYNRLPERNETYKDFKIGKFINYIKYGFNSHLKYKVEDIFNTKIYIDDTDKLELCKEYYNDFKKLPQINLLYKDFMIGEFIDSLKYGFNSHLKEEVEDIFNTNININDTKININDTNILELCKEFYTKYKRLPKSNETYKDFKIGYFIESLKHCDNRLKEEVDNIFNTNINFDDYEKCYLFREYYNIYERLPKSNETYRDFNIGEFIYGLKFGFNNYLKERVEDIFNNKIYIDDNDMLELCKEFYNEYKRLPEDNEIYKEFKIGHFFDSLKQGRYSHLKEDVENIFKTKI